MLTEFRTTTRLINSANDELMRPITAKMDDVNGRGLRIQVTDNGVVQDLTDARVFLAWCHESLKFKGIEPFVPIDASSGIFECVYPAHMLHPGTLRAYIQVCYNSRVINTVNFKIYVQDGLGIQSSLENEEQLFVTLQTSVADFYDVIERADGLTDEFQTNYSTQLNNQQNTFNAQLAQQQADFDTLRGNIEEVTGVIAITDTEIDALF